MTLNFMCSKCGYKFEMSFVPNPFPDRPKAVRPARSEDRERTTECPSCEELAAVFDAKAFWSGPPPVYVPSPLRWVETHVPDAKIRDMTHVNTRGGSGGVQRILPGLPGREGGFSKREY